MENGKIFNLIQTTTFGIITHPHVDTLLPLHKLSNSIKSTQLLLQPPLMAWSYLWTRMGVNTNRVQRDFSWGTKLWRRWTRDVEIKDHYIFGFKPSRNPEFLTQFSGETLSVLKQMGPASLRHRRCSRRCRVRCKRESQLPWTTWAHTFIQIAQMELHVEGMDTQPSCRAIPQYLQSMQPNS